MYKILDTKQTNVLYLIRHGWFGAQYELSDNADSYGMLSYEFFSRRTGTAVTATGTWKFEFEGAFSRTILIVDENGIVIGKATRDWFSRKTLLTMETGFQAEFYKPRWFGLCEYIWDSTGYGKIMTINTSFFNFKSTVNIEPGMTPVALIPLLIFLGAHLTILRRRKRAAQH
jgi:hypothetical protein